MTKSETMEHWRNLKADMPILREMMPLPYKAKGSTYGACGIRIDGTPEFIDAVLSHLKELLDGENDETRLGLSRNPVDGSKLGKEFYNREEGAEVCYIRLHDRGEEAQHVRHIMRAVHERATAREAAKAKEAQSQTPGLFDNSDYLE